MCELGKKIFTYFDLDGNAVLDRAEGKVFLDCLSQELNFASGNISRAQFKQWFENIDKDGSSALSVNELIPGLCEFFKVQKPLASAGKPNPVKFQSEPYPV